MYKLRIFVRERVQKLKTAGIAPTLKRVVFLERTLANHAKVELMSDFERESNFGRCMPASDDEVVQSVRDIQRQLQRVQEQLRQQEQQFDFKFQQQQKEIQELRQQLQRQQQ